MLLPLLSVALTHKFQLPVDDWLKLEPLLKEVLGVQEVLVVQQYLVVETPELESEAVTVTLAVVLSQEREVGLKKIEGLVKSIEIVSESVFE